MLQEPFSNLIDNDYYKVPSPLIKGRRTGWGV